MTTTPGSPAKRNLLSWRALASVLIASFFIILVLSGAILFVSPPGRIANWTNWNILGLRKQEWINLHIWFSALFLVVVVIHLLFNWRPFLNYFKDRVTRRPGLRWEWVAALAICGMVYAGTRAGVPPFSSLLAFNERVKESWDEPRQRAPIPHAELLTLAELAQKAGVDLATATSRLRAQGIDGIAPEMIVEQLADRNHRSSQQIYEALTSSPSEGGHGNGGGRGSGFGGGGGPGWKTLAGFCADEGIELKAAIARLQAKGLKVSPDQTMREIAVNNGYNRPYEILAVVRAR